MADNNDFPPSSQMNETKDDYPPSSHSRDTAESSQDIPTGINEIHPTEGANPEHTTGSHNTDHSDTNGLHYCGGLYCAGHNEEEWTEIQHPSQAFPGTSGGFDPTSRPDYVPGETSSAQNQSPYATSGRVWINPAMAANPQLTSMLMTAVSTSSPFYVVSVPKDGRSRTHFGAEQTGEDTNDETEKSEEDDKADDEDAKV
ncbi:hypothetical protein TREMEDRAFT_58767 [Tremella mesenterica DSM 1558]|uniref:uncharacterized protein n=1 Tax=Tremella mesenterica (strain ATCC 24925 / CBS 8224 / DSM 1558 / NBRC 9311 / NRRL Y-6157 / RJB 2259-6 / UBC 559-6) TaxID=578456 RepID=UPI0003F49E22|nr:uncharacterized protein TREMEDRAFT_58767 [Tremella mesenterica DSM 1558]EIW72596.1 hypothetical protein TREMEDRAFT_58767 [Tremella mesenterica DSM 1558]